MRVELKPRGSVPQLCSLYVWFHMSILFGRFSIKTPTPKKERQKEKTRSICFAAQHRLVSCYYVDFFCTLWEENKKAQRWSILWSGTSHHQHLFQGGWGGLNTKPYWSVFPHNFKERRGVAGMQWSGWHNLHICNRSMIRNTYRMNSITFMR